MARRKPTISARGPRVPVYRPLPALPYLGKGASLPQRLLARVMQKRGVRYRPEVAESGGRSLPGGQVIDFILPDYRIYVRVQGEYWHGTAGQMAKDDLQKVILQNHRDQVDRVVDIWTGAILRNPDQAFLETIGRLI